MYKWTLKYFKVIKLDYQYIIKLQNVIRTWNTSRKYSVLVFTVAVDDVTALEMEIPKSTASLQQHWAPATGHLSLVVYFLFKTFNFTKMHKTFRGLCFVAIKLMFNN